MEFWAPVSIPTGAVIRFVDLYYYDTDPSNDIGVSLNAYPGSNSPSLSVIGSAVSSGSSGYGYVSSSQFSYRVDNDVAFGSGAQLAVVINIPLGGLSSSLQFKAADIWWTRDISPAPATATFGDVPTNHPFFRVIEALAASGITQGCGGGNFCPNGAVTRQELAKFLVRALGLYWPDIPSVF